MQTMYLKTNYNNKLACKSFVHIDFAPKDPVPSKDLGQPRELRTADNSHPPVIKKLTKLTRFKLGEMFDCISVPSHGMDACDFINWWKQQTGVDESAELAVYYYMEA